MTEHDTTEPTLAVKTDTRLAELYTEEMSLAQRIGWELDTIHRTAGDKHRDPYDRGPWLMTHQEAVDADPRPGYEATRKAEAVKELATFQARAAEVHAEEAQLNALWREHGCWSRFFMVRGGHIHSSMECSTCNKGLSPTEFGWLPELSGLTEADAVAAHGALLCTICFPSAPVEWTNHYEEQAAKKEAEKCPGSGSYDYDRATARLGYYTGNYGICNQCGQSITVTKTHKLRAHKPA